VAVLLDAWGRIPPDRRAGIDAEVRRAADAAVDRVAGELEALFARPAAEQTVTPLQVVRTLVREPTTLLESEGVAPVERDPFAERLLPADRYGLAPVTLGDLGDPDLGPLQLAWGLAKTAVLRGR
jgi:hypothetical protein